MGRQNKIVAVVFNCTITIIIKFFKIFINGTIAIISYFKRIQRCPPIKNDLLYITATELARKIRKGEVTSKEVITTYITRIKEVNTVINAVIEERFVDAISDAEKVDDLLASKKYTEEELETKFPLLGLPVTVKSSIAVKGMIFVGGRYYSDLDKHRATKDADIVRQTKEAGGIILLISSCPELCKNFECFNKIIGTTRNPYDSRRTSGGSSGGEAALLGTGASLIGLGSDMAGSCRVPAAFCCVFGHKPSAQSVSIEGHYPDSGDREKWTNNFVLGPMVRYAEDLPLLMKVISKPEKLEDLELNNDVDVSKINIFYRFDDAGRNFTDSVNEDICKGIKEVVNHFRNIGCNAEEVHKKYFKNSTMTSFMKLLSMDDVDDVFDKQSKNVYIEIIKKMLNLNDSAMFSLWYIAGRGLFNRHATKKNLMLLEKAYRNIKDGLSDILKDDGVFIYPTAVGPAFFHGQVYGNFFNAAYTAIFNVLGFPSTSCPIGFDSQGLPIGIQVIGNINSDRLTFAVAQEIQKVFGGWKPPPFSSQ